MPALSWKRTEVLVSVVGKGVTVALCVVVAMAVPKIVAIDSLAKASARKLAAEVAVNDAHAPALILAVN